jgi:heat shock factor-binding protein 1
MSYFLTYFIGNSLLHECNNEKQSRFKSMGDSIIGRMDELSGRLDELERSIAELMDQAGLEPQYGTTTGGLVGNNSSSSHANNNNNNNGDHNTKKESKAETQRSVL